MSATKHVVGHTLEDITFRDTDCSVDFEVAFNVSRYVPQTYWQPSEGGEVEDIEFSVTALTLFDAEGNGEPRTPTVEEEAELRKLLDDKFETDSAFQAFIIDKCQQDGGE